MDPVQPVQAQNGQNRARARACRQGRPGAAGRRHWPVGRGYETDRVLDFRRQESDEAGDSDCGRAPGPDGEEAGGSAGGTRRDAEDGKGRALYRMGPCSHTRDVALFWTQSGPKVTVEVMLNALRATAQAVASILRPPTRLL